MDFKTIIPDKLISLFVKSILVFEEQDKKQKTILPFFADGYPGLIFQETSNGLLVNPHNKLMPAFFLYGQTIHPIELEMTGAYKLIVFQLYPFVLKSFFNVEPKDLNDNCYNLDQVEGNKGIETVLELKEAQHFKDRVEIITSFLLSLFENKQKELDLTIAGGIKQIINRKGQLNIEELYKELHLTERTFERRFFKSVGVNAKQFAKIIQFQHSFEQLTLKDYTKLTDIVYANGFADQSHFIRVFKAFTGKTPLAFKSQK
ncbi:MAG: AraC family transcriptional regulator [Chitinophagaceae bacterium]|nr:MAG: AraC family transcriptional regulator [Chitinophagaceae bacterium]